MPNYSKYLIIKFWRKVDKNSSPSGCWLWKGRMYRNGYGRIAISRTKDMLVHRFAYEIQFGDIPDGLHVLHTPPCIYRHCVRHLYAGTHQQNMQDCLAMGRFASGERNGAVIHRVNMRRGDQHGLRLHPEAAAKGEEIGTSKLTTEQVLEIRHLYAQGSISQSTLGSMFDVKQSAIYKIVHRQRWKHI